jgi:uracil-DNA glycosylase
MDQQGFDWATPGAQCLQQWPPALEGLLPGWRETVEAFLASEAGQALSVRIGQALAEGRTIYPPEPFRALALTALDRVRVVILGQDPYHGAGQAEGLAFSVAPGIKMPPSLRNIFKELQRSLACPLPPDGSLVRWARQGVLLLNTSLTVEDGQPASHARWGWQALTDKLVAQVAARSRPTVFMLWGAHAQAKRALIDAAAPDGRHRVLLANHPSPLSALRPPEPFMGCQHFSLANAFLAAHGLETVEW